MGLAFNSMLLSVTMGMLSLNKGYKYYNVTYVLHVKRKIKGMKENISFEEEFVQRKQKLLDSGKQKIENELALVPEKEEVNE